MSDDKRTTEDWLVWAKNAFHKARRTGLYGSVTFNFRDGEITCAETRETTKDPQVVAPASDRKVG